jgi:hypothetical protein
MSESPEQTSFSGVVARVVDDYTLVINRGSRHGIEKGDHFLVYYVEDEEIKDPETGESLGKLEVVRGTGSAVHVQENMSTIKSNRTVSKGRVIRRTVNPAFRGIAGVFPGEKETIEEPEREALPFESPSVGDKVKLI